MVKKAKEQEGIEWINNKVVIWEHAIKPCKYCGYCPYGQMVEMFPLQEEDTYRSCKVFGHDCPVYYHAEPFAEDDNTVTNDQCEKWDTEMREKFHLE